MTDLDRSWLVQRLRKPPKREHPIFGKDNPFSFGGGLQNGGLSGEAMDLLREVWSFDYMGAAEFEWGAVPEALSRLAKAKQLNGSEFDIKLSEVAANWRRRDEKPPEGTGTVYLLCPVGWEAAIEDRIRAWAAESTDEAYRTKECVGIASALRPVEEWDYDVQGWLELDNGYLFFTDREMWAKACALFGIEIEAVAA